MTVKDLATKYNMTKQGVIYHLKSAGVEKTPNGRFIITPELEEYIASRNTNVGRPTTKATYRIDGFTDGGDVFTFYTEASTKVALRQKAIKKLGDRAGTISIFNEAGDLIDKITIE